VLSSLTVASRAPGVELCCAPVCGRLGDTSLSKRTAASTASVAWPVGATLWLNAHSRAIELLAPVLMVVISVLHSPSTDDPAGVRGSKPP
jgi:hypothetical protein